MASTATRPKTLHRGADDERATIKAYVKRSLKDGAYIYIPDFIEWLDARTARNKAKKGGL